MHSPTIIKVDVDKVAGTFKELVLSNSDLAVPVVSNAFFNFL
jgi:hypothetical protein